ncbi:prepilin-type N-terminal cleavage/methylation domain-containing protein [Betaproteobacteria bacterium]|nr:prepilin-type N-terminal cleavage/methylation domain-containing protein [Betaproteobacteria bacterium]
MRGFQLLELAIVLSVLGVLTLMTTWAFSGADQKNTRARSAAEAEVAREAIRAFLLANKRLPCPDTDGNGYESCAATAENGFLPYLSLGLTDNVNNRMRYSVYRNAGINDITRLEERTGDAENTPDYRGYGDTLAALDLIKALPLSDAHIRVAGVNPDGSSVCATGTHPAFALIVSNEDKNADGNVLDGINTGMGACLASPLQPFAWNYDDFVLTESSAALMGWLTQHLNN